MWETTTSCITSNAEIEAPTIFRAADNEGIRWRQDAVHLCRLLLVTCKTHKLMQPLNIITVAFASADHGKIEPTSFHCRNRCCPGSCTLSHVHVTAVNPEQVEDVHLSIVQAALRCPCQGAAGEHRDRMQGCSCRHVTEPWPSQGHGAGPHTCSRRAHQTAALFHLRWTPLSEPCQHRYKPSSACQAQAGRPLWDPLEFAMPLGEHKSRPQGAEEARARCQADRRGVLHCWEDTSRDAYFGVTATVVTESANGFMVWTAS